jgi:hypothetical protein
VAAAELSVRFLQSFSIFTTKLQHKIEGAIHKNKYGTPNTSCVNQPLKELKWRAYIYILWVDRGMQFHKFLLKITVSSFSILAGY